MINTKWINESIPVMKEDAFNCPNVIGLQISRNYAMIKVSRRTGVSYIGKLLTLPIL